MIILDTNILREPLRSEPSQSVMRWLNQQRAESLYFTAISFAESAAGIAVMPAGRRRDTTERDTGVLISRLFGTRILSFDIAAARAYAAILGDAKLKGRPISQTDAQIAAIAKANRFAVATRDVEPFRAAGVDVVNPWADE